MEANVIAIIKSSPTMILLLIISVIVFTIIIERFLYLRKSSLDPLDFMGSLRNMVQRKTYDDAVKYCEEQKKPITNVLKTGLMHRHMPKEDIEELVLSVRLEERQKMEKFLIFLGSIGTIAPLLGLMGTVAGLSRAFKDLALSGSAGPSVVAAGISEALYATLLGLAIAIPTVLCYNYLMGKARKINVEIEAASKRLLVWLFEEAK
ncbi:MAG: MotA/TolQ/ExbB proton channel family protein [Elusimicrobia bacterium]|nr:MotA/TolQ/ExbB proton channel family protein [Elusimicrobiota bacterium]